MRQADKLKEAGIDKVVCLAVAKPEEVSDWANKVGLSGSKIETWADTKGAWTRMLGLDENQFDAPGPRSQRSGPNLIHNASHAVLEHSASSAMQAAQLKQHIIGSTLQAACSASSMVPAQCKQLCISLSTLLSCCLCLLQICWANRQRCFAQAGKLVLSK